MQKFFSEIQRGQMLIEIMVALAITALFLPALLTGIVASNDGSAQQKLRFEATALLQQANEAVLAVKDSGWSSVASKKGIVTHPIIQGTTWALDIGNPTVNGFTTSVNISDVFRDSLGAIVSSGGEIDPSTLQADITVSWNSPYNSSVTTSTYLTRFEQNTTQRDDTVSEFSDGITNGTTITNTNGGASGGEVALAQIAVPDWCRPEFIVSMGIDGLGIGRTIQATQGRVLTGTTGNPSITLEKITINDTSPPTSGGVLTWNAYNTNEVFSLNLDDYAYVATPNNDKPVVKVRISSWPFTEVGYFMTDNQAVADGKSVYVVGDTGYAVVGGRLWNFSTTPNNASNNRMPRLDIDGVALYGTTATASRVWVVGNYAYVAADDANNAFQIFDVTTPNDLQQKWKLNVNNRFAKDLFVNAAGTRAYLVTSDKNGKDPDGDGNGQLYIINTSNIATTQPSIINIGGTGTGFMRPRGVVAVSNNKIVVVGKDSVDKEYQVYDTTTNGEENPTSCVLKGGLDFSPYNMYAVAAVTEDDGDLYTYVMTNNPDLELKIFEGGTGGYQYSPSGDYESGIFPLPSPGAVNRISWLGTVTAQTSLKFKVAVADQVDGSCAGATYNYVGPNKSDPNSYFTTPPATGTVPLDNDGIGYENPGQCFRYKAFLSTTDGNQTPILSRFTVNYSL
ncbi:MAG: type II secretion system protein [Candidatus Levybacteria bacterium]|nr:type II secretion system protein [Candidatus Levybacteria bacterium]